MQHKFVEWWDKQKFIVKELEFPMYSSKYDRAGCLDIIVLKKNGRRTCTYGFSKQVLIFFRSNLFNYLHIKFFWKNLQI
ncbi:MAG: hypothetical protein CM15mV87_220 [Caudoviricetes sp.]|nr:MAG: hypothetical protein CM15mV87_220 [Caudoviricetes sp.]